MCQPTIPGIIFNSDLKLGNGIRQLRVSTSIAVLDGFICPVGWVCLCIKPVRGAELGILYTPCSSKTNKNSLADVGNVGKSEQSPEVPCRKVFQNALIAYTS